MANVFQIVVLYFCLTVIAAIFAVCSFFGLKRVFEILRATLSPAVRVAFAVALVVAAVEAQKRGRDDAVGTPPRSFGEAVFLPLPGSVTNEKWRKHGAYQNWMHIPATNWWARSPSGGWLDHVTAFAWCEFRPDLFTTNAWPRPFPERLSLHKILLFQPDHTACLKMQPLIDCGTDQHMEDKMRKHFPYFYYQSD